jgi:hypothetical protein
MRRFVKAGVAAAVGAVALTISTVGASAAVACNAEGECWHVKRHYVYHPEFGVVIHEDSWRWGPSEHFVWREHEGRGYWRHGVWVRF